MKGIHSKTVATALKICKEGLVKRGGGGGGGRPPLRQPLQLTQYHALSAHEVEVGVGLELGLEVGLS